MKGKKEVMVRVNSRFTKEQQMFIKDYAKKHNMKEGEVHRFIIQSFIKEIKK